MSQSRSVSLDKLTALCKRRGFIFQTADIYGGLNGVYDTGPLGTLLKQNIRACWQDSLRRSGYDILCMEGALLGSEAVWEASGHRDGFQDPMIDCTTCKHRYKADDIDPAKPCPSCGNTSWTAIRAFDLMFKTHVGAASDGSSVAYLRPETAQSIFTNFKNIMSSSRVKIPFGIAQIGKAFRNEITPKQFLFRMREFEQMELEWFCTKDEAEHFFALWLQLRREFYDLIGISPEKLRVRAHDDEELSHYAQATSDIEYHYPFGWKELEGVANRGSYDLQAHSTHSGKDLAVYDEATKESYFPWVIESSVGVDRLMLTILCDAYDEQEVEGETRVVLALSPRLAPYIAACLPLSKKLAEPTQALYKDLAAKGFSVQYDVTGSIGKRYRRQDEIGTPVCITYDFDSQETDTVTIRNRDTMAQERISLSQIPSYLETVRKQ